MARLYTSSLVGFIFALLFMGMNACSDALGVSRVKDYYDEYYGDMSYSYYKITFRPNAPTESVEDISVPVLHYGYNLENNRILKAKILQCEIPQEDIEYIFYDAKRYGNLSPDSIYLGWIGLRGNYLGFPFKSKYGFQLTNYTTYSGDDAQVFKYNTLPASWSDQFVLYALACWLMYCTFAIAFVDIANLPEYTAKERLQPLIFIGLYGLIAAYVSSVDYEYSGFPIISAILFGLMIGGYIWQLFVKPKPSITEE